MIENAVVKKMVASILRGRKNASFDRHIMHPEREWFMLVFLGLGIFAVGVGWNIVTDQKFKNISISYDSEAEEQIVYREGLVETALTDFTARRSEYEALKASLVGQQTVPVPVPVPVVSEEVASTTEETPVPEVAIPEPEVIEVIEEFDSGEVTFE